MNGEDSMWQKERDSWRELDETVREFVAQSGRALVVATGHLVCLREIAAVPLDMDAPAPEAGDKAAADYYREAAYTMAKLAYAALSVPAVRPCDHAGVEAGSNCAICLGAAFQEQTSRLNGRPPAVTV